jgi:lipopolysaccharide biosynthesis glycosyltransferase
MNCIFICVFNQEKYVEMFIVMLDSLLSFGNLNKTHEILVYTSSQFKEMIQQHPLFAIAQEQTNMVFAINDNYITVDAACKARLDLFDLAQTREYNKVLYLDTDIIIKGDITGLFDLPLEDKLYALKEGRIEDMNNSHGLLLFRRAPIKLPRDRSAFTTGILLFNNCARIKELFAEVKKIIIRWPYKFHCADQPYIVYMAFQMRAYDNKLMCEFAINNNSDTNSNKIIHHFTGGPGHYQPKIPAMIDFLAKLKLLNIRGQPGNEQ